MKDYTPQICEIARWGSRVGFVGTLERKYYNDNLLSKIREVFILIQKCTLYKILHKISKNKEHERNVIFSQMVVP